MPLIRMLPALLALLVLAAHFYRAGVVFLVPVCLGLVALAFVRLAWVPGVLALALALGSGEWLRTLLMLMAARTDAGESYARLVVILVVVALLTLLAALLAWSPDVRRWYAGNPRDRSRK